MGKLFRRVSRSSWTRPYGRLGFLKTDAGDTNFSEELLTQMDRGGTTLIGTAADQHEQVGCVEGDDCLYEERLLRTIAEYQPHDWGSWIGGMEACNSA